MPNPKAHIAIDLETLSTSPDAVVLAIGAAAIAEGGELLADFYSVCSLASQRNRRIDEPTLDWWERQSVEARAVLNHANDPSSPSLSSALKELTHWIGDLGEDYELFIWGNGAAFDVAILEHAYKQSSPFVPWNFRNVRDMRTLYDLTLRFGLDIKDKAPRVGIHHNAKDDARFQALVIIESLRQLQTLADAHRSKESHR